MHVPWGLRYKGYVVLDLGSAHISITAEGRHVPSVEVSKGQSALGQTIPNVRIAVGVLPDAPFKGYAIPPGGRARR